MSLVERFTRDSASKFVWGGLLLVALAGLAFAFKTGGDEVREERLDAEQRAVAAVEDVLAPALEGVDLEAPIEGHDLDGLREAVGSITADPRVARVAIWAQGGELLFSTDRADDIGSKEALNDELLQRAGGGVPLTRWNVSDVGGEDEEGRSLLRTYAPIRSGAVAEIDHAGDLTVAPLSTAWMYYRITAAAAVAILLLMTILSMRDPVARINAGVRFSPTAIPSGYAMIDEERLHAVEEVYRLAHDRVARLESRLAESEDDRRRLEGVLQRTLTGAPAGPGRPFERALQPIPLEVGVQPEPPPERASDEPRRLWWRRSAEPVEEEEEEFPAASDEPPPIPTAPPLADVSEPVAQPEPPEPEPWPPVSSEPEPDAQPTPPEPGTPPARGPADVVTVPESEVVEPARGSSVRREEDSEAPTGPAAESTKRRRQRPKRRREAPAATVENEPAISDTDDEDAAAHEEALETFIRLTERDRERHETADVDQGAIRAALARTAARKKPGSSRLQPHEDSVEEVQGGGPRRDRS